ncbi:MAG: membrane protein insertion efficiency factor YidD [Candidatus Marinimicrobia bacterium]|nr:membrane protein insertion efficiency factor YidD [Candidatus Neomarinimicrobiota bacterium]
MLKYASVIFVKIYQNTLGLLLPASCRYSPSCSHYTIQAIQKYGAGKGSLMGIKRILRCHPFSNHNLWDPLK